jgi:alginate O-acetyltransferase complex protein AlgI
VLFNSLDYLVFLPVTWIAFWTIKKRRVELLLIASYVFYASWSPPYALLVFGMAVTNYIFGRLLHRPSRYRGLELATFVAFDLGVLALFKYANFAIATAWPLGRLFGITSESPFIGLVLPLGISFFTFEFIHYLVDIYRGAVPVHGFSKFHVFAAFFPTQIAGPIKRFQQFVPALERLDNFDSALALDGLRLIGFGLAKKVLLADRLAPMANRGFSTANEGVIGTSDAWMSAMAFSLQIFFDFSAYTDIARGSAQLFGFHIPINFNAPYLATSPIDFWRRWHISLSTWLRDYVFIPLGGSRRSMQILVRNILITFALGGLWHGAAWHFVTWGLFWGVAISLNHLLRARIQVPTSGLATVAGWGVTQGIVLIGWVLFRSDTFASAATMLRAMVVPTPSGGVQTVSGTALIVAIGLGLILLSLSFRWEKRLPHLALPSPRLHPVYAGIAAALVLGVGAIAAPSSNQAFIYFQF